jgi:hypothetical protein
MIIRVDERRRVDPDQLVVLVAVHPAEGGVDLHDQTCVEVVDDQPVARRLEDPSILLLPLEQPLLSTRPLLLRHLPRHTSTIAWEDPSQPNSVTGRQ